MKPTPTLLEAAKALISVYDEQSNVAQRIICGGRSDRQLREDGLAALKDLRDAVAALSVPPAAVVGEPVAWTTQAQIDKFKVDPGCNAVMWGEPLPHHPDIPLYAAPSAPDGWQPIETAPKDGRHVILYCDYYGVGRCAWESWRGVWRSDDPNHGIGFPQPTHWMPLPDFPADSIRAEIARRAVLAATNEDQP